MMAGSAVDGIRDLIERATSSGKMLGSDGVPCDIFPVAIERGQAAALTEVVCRERPSSTIEVGLGFGIATLAICQGLLSAHPDGQAHHLVMDPYQRYFRNAGLKAVQDLGLERSGLVEFHGRDSRVVLPWLLTRGRRFDFAFVDGDHRFEGVFMDLAYLHWLVRPDGLVVVDDADWPAVGKAIRFCLSNLQWRREDAPGSSRMVFLRRPATEPRREPDHFVDF